MKYRHLLDEALALPEGELAVLCVLMLRGPQMPGELKQRTERLHPLPDLGAVQATLERLIDRDLAVRLERRPGQKEERYAHRLSDDAEDGPRAALGGAPEPVGADPVTAGMPARNERPAAPPDARLARLEQELAALRAEVDDLRAALDALRADLGA